MVYVTYNRPSLKHVVDEFLFAKYIKRNAKGKNFFNVCLIIWKYVKVPLRGIIAVAADQQWLVVAGDLPLY